MSSHIRPLHRTCIRFYEEAGDNGQWEKVNDYYCEVVGETQGEEMWLLQRICEEGRPFLPLPANFDNFKRGVRYNSAINSQEDLLQDGKLADELGLSFAIEKGRGDFACSHGEGHKPILKSDLMAICWLVESAKANVIECEQEQDLQSQSSYNAQ